MRTSSGPSVLSGIVSLLDFIGVSPSEGAVLSFIIIIIFYFENVAFFHAKLGSDVCPGVDNQTSGETLQDLTCHQPVIHPWVLERVFGGGMPSVPPYCF